MAAVEITKHALPQNAAGYDLTDSADFTTLVSGSGNGVKFTYEDGLILVLKNDSGSAATYTLKVPASSSLAAYGGTITSPTCVVANGKTVLLILSSLFRDAATGFVTVECSAGGKALLLEP